MPTDLYCFACQRQAFAVVNLEIPVGRARYPICPLHIDLALKQSAENLRRAAAQGVAHRVGVEGYPEAIEVDARNVE